MSKCVKTETLIDDMKNIGFSNFNNNILTKKININYDEILTNEIKEIIYTYYKEDFVYFGYNK